MSSRVKALPVPQLLLHQRFQQTLPIHHLKDFSRGSRPSASRRLPLRILQESAIKLIPKFNENDIESVLISFEKIVSLNSFPAEKYAAVLQAHLTGKALKVFTELTAEECQNYATLKAALLNAYAFAVYPKDIPKLIQNLLSGCPHNFVAGWRVKTRLLHVERLR